MEQQNTSGQAEIFQNVPPHDDAAELAVLGAMFLDREAASLALEMLTGEDFYRPDHRQVFEAAEELYHSGVPIDMITVKNKLEEKQVFEQIGGLPFLANISTSVGSSANMRHYAAIVEEKSVLRRLIRTANNISQMSYEGKTDVNAIMDTAEKGIFDIMQNRHSVPPYPGHCRGFHRENRGHLPFQRETDWRTDRFCGLRPENSGTSEI